MEKIITNHVFPPIPIRNYDWIAYFDGDEEGKLKGYGKTEQEAKDNLISQWAEESEN